MEKVSDMIEVFEEEKIEFLGPFEMAQEMGESLESSSELNLGQELRILDERGELTPGRKKEIILNELK
jgi:hypothetical protein